MGEDWEATVKAERDDEGFFTPVLVVSVKDGEATEAVRVPLSGVYQTAEEAVAAGREAVKAMAAGDGTTPDF